jgi:uncharacterized protein YceH (UPF0502 family)
MPALELNALEARVLGVLVEKERTTPEGYPLSLNALVAGCNQKSNRDPVLNVGEREVNAAILNLRIAGLVEFVQLVGQRVEKYKHKAGAGLHLEPAEVAVLAELLLRGSQQPGELRARVERMHPLPTLEALQAVLDAMAAKGLVVRLERRPGERTARWAQLLAPGDEAVAGPPPVVAAGSATSAPLAQPPGARPPPAATPSAPHAAPAGLEARVARLEAQVAELRAQLGLG